jgi:hypothetical protein
MDPPKALDPFKTVGLFCFLKEKLEIFRVETGNGHPIPIVHSNIDGH